MARGRTLSVDAIVRSTYPPSFEEGLCALASDPRLASVGLADGDVVLMGDACLMVEVLDDAQCARLATGGTADWEVSAAVVYGGPELLRSAQSRRRPALPSRPSRCATISAEPTDAAASDRLGLLHLRAPVPASKRL